MSKQRLWVPVSLPVDFVLQEGESERIYLLLHGFMQSGEIFHKLVKEALPEGATIISPNGMFPIPKRVEGGFDLFFSWYFYDIYRAKYYIEQGPACEFLQGLINQLGLQGRPITLIGYSQGGYLAPFVGQTLNNVDHVIGLSCELIPKLKSTPFKFKADIIHGRKDDVVNPEHVAKNFSDLQADLKFKGDLHWLEESGHKIDKAMRAKLKELLQQSHI